MILSVIAIMVFFLFGAAGLVVVLERWYNMTVKEIIALSGFCLISIGVSAYLTILLLSN
jgi:hypothetical protein